MNPLNIQDSKAQYMATNKKVEASNFGTSILKSSNETTNPLSEMKTTTAVAVEAMTATATHTTANFMDAGHIINTGTVFGVDSKMIYDNMPRLVTSGNQQLQSSANIINASNLNAIPVVAVGNPMFVTSGNQNNLTYQVLATHNGPNVGSFITTSSANGAVNVLLAPSGTTMTTPGHVGQASIIIRNQPVQMKQQQQQQQQDEVVKQIVRTKGQLGSVTTNTMIAPRTTLLKTSLLQPKQSQQPPQQPHEPKILPSRSKKNLSVNKILIARQQQQKSFTKQLKKSPPNGNHVEEDKNQSLSILNKDVLNVTQSKILTTTTTTLAAEAPATVHNKLPTVPNINKMGKIIATNQISLLQHPKKLPYNEINGEKNSLLKSSNEVKVAEVSSEVSLIKKSSSSGNVEKSNENGNSLLKLNVNNKNQQINVNETASCDIGSQRKESLNTRSEVSLLKPIKTAYKPNGKEEMSLLKATGISTPSVNKINMHDIENGHKAAENNKKQESLLKSTTLQKAKVMEPVKETIPRYQRSQSLNSLLKSPKDNAANNERRHSVPLNNSNDIQTDVSAKFVKKNLQKIAQPATIREDDEGEQQLEELEENSKMPKNTNQQENCMSPPASENNFKQIKSPVAKNANSDQQQITTNDSTELLLKKEKLDANENSNQCSNTVEDDDDDVTILPVEGEILPIEIDDDDDDDGDGCEQIGDGAKNNDLKYNKSLLCEEQVLMSSSSSISTNSSENIAGIVVAASPSKSITSPVKSERNTNTSLLQSMPLLKKTLTETKSVTGPNEPGYSSVLDVLSNFNMLSWRERVGTARGTNLKFQLNEFNLVQVHERCPPRLRIHTAYEKPLSERQFTRSNNATVNNCDEPPLLYQCRRCRCHGPAVDFLAPEFCSLLCLKRDTRKRQREDVSIARKRSRISDPFLLPLLNAAGPKFRWNSYLQSNQNDTSAPISLFLNPFPTGPNNFKVGMKLEAIDPDNCSLFCVCTVIEINGYRLKLNFDGYDSTYDFWVNADSMDIFPPGWCAKTNHILQPPKGINHNKFNWTSYLNKERAAAAPRSLFTHLNTSSLTPRNPFKIGMHLEAEDLNDTGKLCVATVADILGDRIRIHFDGWDECYDIIADINSPYIHPCGWHEGRQQLVVPPECENSSFNWSDYIRKHGRGVAASDEFFDSREPINFRAHMKLEVVDPRNPSLIRPATVMSHKGHRVKLHLDCWPADYCFWLEDDSPDLHPIGWCDATGHDLEPPPGYQMSEKKMPCPITGCRGIGNARKPSMSVHANRDCCPYAPENWRIVKEKPIRLSYEEIVRLPPPQNVNQNRLSEQQILERLQMLDNIKPRRILLTKDNLQMGRNDFIGFPSTSAPKAFTPAVDTKNHSINSSAKTTIAASDGNNNTSELSVQVAKRFLCDYGPRLQQNYDLWQKNFDFNTDQIKRNPMLWSITEVAAFVERELNVEMAEVFKHEAIDGAAFLMLQQNDLTDNLDLKLGPSVRLFAYIMQLRTLAVTKFNVSYNANNK